IYGRTSKSSWSGITIGSGCTRRWAIDLRKNSSERLSARPHLEARRWSFLRTKRTTKRLLKDCWGKGLKCRPLPQTPSPARRCKNAFRKAEAVSKQFVPSKGVTPGNCAQSTPKSERLFGAATIAQIFGRWEN